MANILYHWNFTSNSTSNDALGETIQDSESSVLAEVKQRGSVTSNKVIRNTDGVNLNNVGDEGFYIDLYGLDTVSLGGNITIEMVVKNNDLSRQSLYFQTIRDQETEINNDSAFISCKYNSNKMNLLLRTDSLTSGAADYRVEGTNNPKWRTANSSDSSITSNSFMHYIFTISYISETSNMKIFINGSQSGTTQTADLKTQLSNTLRQCNFIGTQKNQTGATHLQGVVKYLKFYQGVMTDSEVQDKYNNYNSAPYYGDISSSSDSDKFTRRHSELDTFFTNNSSVTNFEITGNQLGLSSGAKTYTVYKFTGSNQQIDISSGNHYIPLSGQNQYIIFKNGTSWYKITQTSTDDGTSTTYKYEVSTNSGTSYGDAVTGKVFGDSFVHGDTTIAFGGVEATNSSSNICILEGSYINTDQGSTLIEHLTTEYTINSLPILYIFRSLATQTFICFKKNCFDYDIPNKDTYISSKHLVYDRKRNLLTEASTFIDDNKIFKINIENNKYCYHILLQNWSLIEVNNIECETLCSINNISINFYKKNFIYNDSFIDILKKQQNVIITTNDVYVKNKKILFKNKLCYSK